MFITESLNCNKIRVSVFAINYDSYHTYSCDKQILLSVLTVIYLASLCKALGLIVYYNMQTSSRVATLLHCNYLKQTTSRQGGLYLEKGTRLKEMQTLQAHSYSKRSLQLRLYWLLKVTLYLQGCLQINWGSTSRSYHINPNPYIELKPIDLPILIFHFFFVCLFF